MNIYFFGYLSDFGISRVGLFGLVWLDIGLIFFFFFCVFIDHDFVLQHNNAKENSLANIHSFITYDCSWARRLCEGNYLFYSKRC